MRTPQFTPMEMKDRPRPWSVNIPATYSQTGKRERKFFNTKREALDYAKDEKIRVEREGRDATATLSVSQRDAAAAAFRLLGDQPPQRLLEIVEEWSRLRKMAAASAPLREVFDRYEARGRKVRARSGAVRWVPFRPSYLQQFKYAKRHAEPLADLMLSDITAAQIEAQLAGCSPAYAIANLRSLRAVFEYGIEEGLAAKNPITKKMIEGKGAVAGADDDVETPILTIDETRQLLAAAAEAAPYFIPYIALSLFAGIRPDLTNGELIKMEWSMIRMDEKMVIIPAKVSKTRAQRIVHMEQNLVDWLRYYLTKYGKAEGQIIPLKGRVNRMRTLRKAAEIEWKQDVARHSFGSYFMSHFENLSRCMENMGHQGSTMLFKHYKTAVPKTEAAQYWQITPDALGLA